MAVGTSGRIVVEFDPSIKKSLHEAIKKEGMNFKEWLEKKAREDFPEVFNVKPKVKTRK